MISTRTFPADFWTRIFLLLGLGELECFHSNDCCFVFGSWKCTQSLIDGNKTTQKRLKRLKKSKVNIWFKMSALLPLLLASNKHSNIWATILQIFSSYPNRCELCDEHVCMKFSVWTASIFLRVDTEIDLLSLFSSSTENVPSLKQANHFFVVAYEGRDHTKSSKYIFWAMTFSRLLYSVTKSMHWNTLKPYTIAVWYKSWFSNWVLVIAKD